MGALRAYHVLLRQPNELGPLFSPVALRVHDSVWYRRCTRHGAFWLKPAISIFGLSLDYDVYQAFTYVDHIIHPSP